MEQDIINERINFYEKRKSQSIKNYSDCLLKYSNTFESEVSLKTQTPIFLDTNVLLRYYSVSYHARSKFLEFFKQNSDRIIISKQVQYEFIKNREKTIHKFFEQVTDKIPKEYKSDIINGIKKFLDNHKTVLKDYPTVERDLTEHKLTLEKVLESLNETIQSDKEERSELIYKDKFLDIINSCTFYEGLSDNEQKILTGQFDKLSSSVSSLSIDQVLNKSHTVFPGFGDIKNKPEDPQGDYIIFHEMIKYSIDNKTDVSFLTFDNTKGDWMSKSKEPYIHYVQNFYSNTDKMLFIIDAERTLEDIFKINIDSLVQNETTEYSHPNISAQQLDEFISSSDLFVGRKIDSTPQSLVQELILNGYESMSRIESELLQGQVALSKYEKEYSLSFSSTGIIRVSLQIVNPDYLTVLSKRGVESVMSESQRGMINRYRKYVIH